jgi:nitroimidazol reductase NimA-like FMN-containing flavoprotein (pyridoxamine 5'-phosphate oxidase superfamily)
MRGEDHEISDRLEMESVLKKADVCRLGCVENGRPYLVPLSFGYNEGSIFIHSASEGQKINILKKNPDCCIEVDECSGVIRAEKPCRWGMRYRSVICRGKAYFINDPDEKRLGLHCILDHYGAGTYIFSEAELQDVCVIRIDIDEMTGKKSGC